MKKLTLISLLAVLTLPLTAKADFLGLYVGGGVWQHAPSGGIGYNDTKMYIAKQKIMTHIC